MKSSMYENKSYIEHFGNLKSPMKILDKESRNVKTEKILSVIFDFSRKEKKITKDLSCLDIGCSGGFITSNISDYFGKVVGLDTDKKAIDIAKKTHKKSNLDFVVGSGLDMPFPEESFDVVICNHIYEHVPDYKKLFSEIYRVLKKGGFCYLSAGNKYIVMEGHYHLPFLSWLPQDLANLYLRLTRKGDVYEEEHKSYFKIMKAIRKFRVFDYTIDIMKNPVKYKAADMINPKGIIPKIPYFIYDSFKPFLPTYIFILRKD